MKFSLLHPSRGRPQKAIATYNYWLDKASGENVIEHIFSIDFDDPFRWAYPLSKTTTIISDNSSVVEATNKAAEQSKGDILIYLSDDFKCPLDWDLLILNKVKDKDLFLLKVNDGLQPFNVPVLTIPIMSRKLYEHLGYFWNPLYKSMFVDEDLYHTCKHWICEAPELVFQHEHFINGMAENDETYQRSNANWNQGKEVYAKRKELNFPI